MLHENKTSKTAKPTDFDEIMAQVSALREDMTSLTQSVTSMAEKRGRRMASDIADGVGEAADYVGRKGQTAEAEFERTFAAHPLLALGLAAGAGLLIGALSRR